MLDYKKQIDEVERFLGDLELVRCISYTEIRKKKYEDEREWWVSKNYQKDFCELDGAFCFSKKKIIDGWENVRLCGK